LEYTAATFSNNLAPKLPLAFLEAKAVFASLPPFYVPSFQVQALEPTSRIIFGHFFRLTIGFRLSLDQTANS
jgi:hypothetical protein